MNKRVIDPRWALDRFAYQDLIRHHFHDAKDIVRARMGSLSKRIFELEALKRFDDNVNVYGPIIDLTDRNWASEGREEVTDAFAYALFEIESRRRDK